MPEDNHMIIDCKPYDPEWEKEMMKIPKKGLILMIRNMLQQEGKRRKEKSKPKYKPNPFSYNVLYGIGLPNSLY